MCSFHKVTGLLPRIEQQAPQSAAVMHSNRPSGKPPHTAGDSVFCQRRVGLPDWFAGPNQFIQCVWWPISSFLTSWWTTAERQPYMRLRICGSSRARTIRSPSPCRPLRHTPPPPPVMFRFLCRSQCHTLRARCSSTSLLTHPPNALSSVGALVPCAAPTLALDVSQASVYCTALGSDIFPRRHVDPHGVIHGDMLVCICE